MAKSYPFDKTELRKKLKQFGLSDAHLEEVMTLFDRKNRRMDVVTFVLTLEKLGASRTQASNFLKEIGIEETVLMTISSKVDFKKAGVDDKKVQEVILKG
ncbi:MAG: hypothetical protein NT130_03010 [Candidatus Micrarchaeota archaeon]|nr:hypothetical protein [Candidatus Micrarchaeota archaeon]